MDSKVIWIVNQYGGSRLHGMTFRSYYLAKEFAKRHKVVLFSASYSHVMSSPPEVKNSATREEIDGIEYCWLKVGSYAGSKSKGRIFSMFVFLFRLFTVDTSCFERPNVIIVSSISPFPILRAYFWAKRFDANLIFEVRDIWPLSIIELGGFSRYHPFIALLQWVEDFAYRVSDFVVSVLPNAYEHMKHHGLSEDRFVCIPNGLDLGAKHDPLNVSVERQLPDNKFLIAYSGAIGIANSVITLVEAAEILRDQEGIFFVIVGDGDQRQSIQARVDLAALTNVLILNPIAKTQVQSLLNRMDVCYIGLQNQPLFRFGISPNKMFDYLYSGRPIIQAIRAGNDLVKESNAGISVAPENPQQIAAAILRLYKMSEQERRRLGENGRRYVEANHSYEKLAERYEKIFD